MELIDPRPLDILDGDFYINDPYPRYGWLREHSPLHWDDVNELWVVTRYDDIVEIEKNKTVFISSDKVKGGSRPNIPGDNSIINLDDPLHQTRRLLIARRFTPRAVRSWEDHVTDTVNELLDPALAKEQAEIVGELAAPLPAKMIGLLLGFPDELWPKLQHWSETTIALGGGPRYANDEGFKSALDFAAAASQLYGDRKGCPAEDVMSRWVGVEQENDGEVGGAPFGHDQILSDPAGAGRPPRAVGGTPGRCRHDSRHRGVHPLGHPDPQHVPGCLTGPRDARPDHLRRPAGGARLHRSQP